ncbi:MAG: hypothetical protein H6581_19220 [Bacteroidia bacterium]|nr:hypothetical protein [Bacteroidia bacterium]
MSTVIINGIPREMEYQRCTRCIQDSSVPGISFDEKGECNYCSFHDRMCEHFPNDERGAQALQKMVDRIKKAGKGRKYDCVIGVSGGRDSSFLWHLAVKEWGLRPLALHFNDGFDNPDAGENMMFMQKKLKEFGSDFRTYTSPYPESRDLKITELKASTPQLNTGTDIGIAASLYHAAAVNGVKYILFGQSFRTEGIKPLSWAYFDGDYLRTVHKLFGEIPLSPRKKTEDTFPGYHLGVKELAYYAMVKGVKVVAPLYNYPYVRKQAEEILKREYNWVYPGAHYYDDLYWALINVVHRKKFNVDLRLNSYSALVRDGQMDRDEAIESVGKIYAIEDPDVIRLCIKRLQLKQEDFDAFMEIPPKTFMAYPNSYKLLRTFKWGVWLVTQLGFLPRVVYDKYFTIPPY